MKSLLNISSFLLVNLGLFAQDGVGIGITKPDESAILHVDAPSRNKGMLVPRLTTLEMNNIVNPANGLIIYNSDENTYNYYDSASTTCCWVQLIPNPLKFNIEMASHKIIDLANGTDPGDAVNKAQLDAVDNTNLDRDGSEVMTGNLNMNNRKVTNVQSATNSGDAVTLGQLEASTGAAIIGTSPTQLANFSGTTVNAVLNEIDDDILINKLATSTYIGNIGPNNYEIGTINHNAGTLNYIVLHSIETPNFAGAEVSSHVVLVIYDKTPNSFKYLIRERVGGLTEVIRLRFVVAKY